MPAASTESSALRVMNASAYADTVAVSAAGSFGVKRRLTGLRAEYSQQDLPTPNGPSKCGPGVSRWAVLAQMYERPLVRSRLRPRCQRNSGMRTSRSVAAWRRSMSLRPTARSEERSCQASPLATAAFGCTRPGIRAGGHERCEHRSCASRLTGTGDTRCAPCSPT